MSTPPTPPNLFLLLDLDPGQAWDQAEFERRLKQKQQEWSRQVNVPTQKGIQAKRNLSHIPELKRIANDEAARAIQAAEAKAAGSQRDAEQRQKLDEELALLQAKGWLLEDELQALAVKYASVATEADIRKGLAVQVHKSPPNEGRARREALEPSKAKAIDTKLQALGKASLYEFLGTGLTAAAELSVLCGQADTLYRQVYRKGSKSVDDGLTAELAGYCLEIFKSDADKSKYDETLRQQRFVGFKEKLDVAAAKTRRVSQKQVQHLLQEARKQGLDADEILAVLLEHAQTKGYAVIMPAPAALAEVKKLRRCGQCGELNPNDAAQSHCTACGQALAEACPRCAQSVASDQQACGGCGFPVGNRAWVLQLQAEASEATRLKDHDLAGEYLEQARRAWPDAKTGAVRQALDELREKNAAAKALRDNLLARLREAARERRFQTVRELLPQAAGLLPDGHAELAALDKNAQAAIAQAEATLARARRAADPETAVQIYNEALSFCADCREAREALARTPPTAPTNVEARLEGGIVRLSWPASRSAGVGYRVLRKAGTRPNKPDDGKVLGNVAGTVFDDATPEIGVPLYYAVYAERGGVCSASAAITPRPLLQTAEVSGLALTPGDRKLSLRWHPPPTAAKIWVVRDDGKRFDAGQRGQFEDGGLHNGQMYRYTVFCEFLDGLGGNQLSVGVRGQATPQPPLGPIVDLRVEAEGPAQRRMIRLRWTPPHTGESLILRAQQAFPWRFGETVAKQDLAAYLHIPPAAPGEAEDCLECSGLYHYLPVALQQDVAYIGRTADYRLTGEITDLEIQNLGHALRLRWRWPAGCEEAVVAYNHYAWPQPDSGTILTKAEYDVRGCHEIADLVVAAYYIRVSAVFRQDGQRFTSDGCRKHLESKPQIKLSYQIKKTGLLSRLVGGGPRFSLVIDIQGTGMVPALVLVCKQGGLPLGKQDGRPILHLPPIADEKLREIIDLPAEACGPQHYAKLYLADDAGYDFVTIHTPSRDDTRLF